MFIQINREDLIAQFLAHGHPLSKRNARLWMKALREPDRYPRAGDSSADRIDKLQLA
jgi:hypothetical protein